MIDPDAWRFLRRGLPNVLLGALVVAVFMALSALRPTWLSVAPAAEPLRLDGAVVVATLAPVAGPALRESVVPGPTSLRQVLADRLSLGAAVLASVWAMLGLAGLALAATQRHRNDLVFGLSGLSWALYTVLAARTMPGLVPPQPVSMPLQQGLMLLAVGLLVWSVLRQLGWRLHDAPSRPVWPAWVAGLGLACVVSWSRGVDESTGPWLVPITCLATGFLVLARGLRDWRDGAAAARRPLPAHGWWVGVLGAVTIACGAYEVWLRIAHPHWLDTRATLWFLTRWLVVLLMAGMLLRRLGEVARTVRQLGRSHRHWRARLRSAQAEVDDLHRALSVRETVEQQGQQRDQVLRELLDELLRPGGADPATGTPASPGPGHDLAGSGTAPVSPGRGRHALRWLRDSLEPAPRPLLEVIESLQPALEERVGPAGVRLLWQIDPATAGVILPAGETLLWQRLADEAVAVAVGQGWAREGLRLEVDVHEGETGRHLHLAVGPADARVRAAGSAAALPERDLFGAPVDPGVRPCRGRLQRLATALGAQVVIAAQPDEPGGLEVVKALKAR